MSDSFYKIKKKISILILMMLFLSCKKEKVSITRQKDGEQEFQYYFEIKKQDKSFSIFFNKEKKIIEIISFSGVNKVKREILKSNEMDINNYNRIIQNVFNINIFEKVNNNKGGLEINVFATLDFKEHLEVQFFNIKDVSKEISPSFNNLIFLLKRKNIEINKLLNDE